MAALRFAKRETAAAAHALAAFRALRRSRYLPADALCFGLPALRTAAVMLSALAAADGEVPPALSRAEELLARVSSERLPAGLKDLAVGGDELLELCLETGMPRERIGELLSTLWRDAVNGRVPNDRTALLFRARKHWVDSQNRG